MAQSGHGRVHRLLLGVKRTCLFALHMSAFDPKRTFGPPPLANEQSTGRLSVTDSCDFGGRIEIAASDQTTGYLHICTDRGIAREGTSGALVFAFGDQDFVTAAQDSPPFRCFLFRQHIGGLHA
jgi:hypothetical protein